MKKYLLLSLIFFVSLNLISQNNCLEFDGTDDYVNVPDDNSLDLSSEMTIEFWIYLESSSGKEVLSKSVADDNENFRIYIDQSNSSQIYFDYGNKYCQTHSFALTTSAWYHMAFSISTGNQGIIYVNGIEASSYSTRENAEATIPTNNHAMEIGGCSFTGRYFDGKLDEVRLWNNIRTETEIRQNMYRELPNPSGEANLAAYYKLNESGSATTAADSKGSNDGTLTNYGSQSGYWQTSPAMFGPKNALDFDGGLKTGNPDYAYKNSNVTSTTDNFTMMAWIKPDVVTNGSNGWRCIAYNGSDAGGYGIGIADSKVASLFGGISWNITNEVLEADNWYHITMRRSSGTTEFFLNGKLLDYTTTSTPKAVNSKFTIGNMFQSNNTDIYTDSFDGEIDEVRVFDAAITDQQIREYMCKSLTGNESNLVAYYNFDNSSGTKLQSFDGSTSNDLTLVNMSNDDWVNSSAFNTWLNTTSSSWSTTSNWSRGSKPSLESVGIYSYSGGSAPTFDNNDEAGGENVVVSMNSDWSLGGNFYVQKNMFLENNINLNGNNIGLGSSAYLFEENGHIYGTSGYISTQRNLSNINENVAGMGAEITTSANMGYTTIKRYHGANSSPNSIKRKYEISPTINTGLSATLVFHYRDDELNSLSESYLELYKSSDMGESWTDMNGSVNTFVNTITLEEIDGFSLWTAMESEDVTPPILNTDDPNHDFITGSTAIVIAPNATVTTSSNLENATVSISPIITEDLLSVINLPTGLTSSWDNSTKILSISGEGTASDYQTALRNVKFETTATTEGIRTIDFILGDGVGLMINGEQHYYEVIYNGVNYITWNDARSAALASRFGAAQGYLATVTSEDENDYLAEKVNADTWIGASDFETEDVWKWMDGPETGTQFWQGDASGSAVGGNYENWSANEPNDSFYSHGEDCAHMYGSNSGANAGYWNDYYNAHGVVYYYIVEYGGDGSTFTTIDDATVNVISEITWDGSEDSNWNTAENWNIDAVPTEYCNITIPDVATYPILGITDQITCNNLTVNSGATFTIISTNDGTGSLIVEGTATGNVTIERFLTANKWHYISGQTNISDDFSTIMGLGDPGSSSNSFYRWDESLETDEIPGTWIDILNGPTGNGNNNEMGTTFTACRGYAITYATTDKTLSLSGVPYVANKTITITNTETSTNPGSNLVGNPFCSDIAINLNANTENFITQNASVLHSEAQAVYFWDDTQNDYEAKSNVGEVFAEPGQGFMVIAKDPSETLEFNVSIRKHGSSVFYKDDYISDYHIIELQVLDVYNRINKTDIAFIPGMTKGLDPSYDAMKLKGNPNIALYTRLVDDNGTDFAIQALNDVNIESYIIPVGVDVSEESVLEFSISKTNIDQNVYLEDRLLNTSTNLSLETYSANISNSGIGRFFLHFAPVGISETENIINPIHVFANGKSITIINNNNLYGMVYIKNIIGQEVAKIKLNGNNTQNYTLNVQTGVYIVYAEINNIKTISEKIIIK